MLRKPPISFNPIRALHLFLLAVAVLTGACLSHPASAQNTPDNLRAKYAALGDQLKNNPFHRALVLESAESPSNLKGDVYAVIDYPFAAVNTALNNPAHWCDVLILHLNIKYCKAAGDAAAPTISVNLGKKNPQELKDTYHVDFKYRNETAGADYFSIMLGAASGPLNTSNYRIHLEAVAIDPSHSFLHLTYSYDYGFAGKMAMKAYLATAGSDKIGFTRVNGAYVKGVRGVVERNTMRYYLAIDAYLSAMNAAPSEQFEKTHSDMVQHHRTLSAAIARIGPHCLSGHEARRISAAECRPLTIDQRSSKTPSRIRLTHAALSLKMPS